MANVQDLPSELIDLILMNFQKRDYALRACSLLSKSWRAATLPHLFSTFRSTPKGGELLPTDIGEFLESHTHISACIKHLWLDKWSTISPDLIRALLSRLPALERLSLELTKIVPAFTGRSPGEYPTEDGQALPCRLKTVIVNHCDLRDDPSNLLDILSLCEVETLKAMFVRDTIRGPRCSNIGEAVSSRRCLRIRDLRLGAHKRLGQHSPTGLLQLLRAGMVPGYLRSMEFTCDGWRTLGLTGALLHEVGQNVATFKLNLMGLVLLGQAEVQGHGWGDLQLSSCTRLEVFVLHAQYPYYLLCPTMHDSTLFSTYADILRLLPPSVRIIRLRLSGNFEPVASVEERAGDIAVIEQAVLEDNRHRFPELEAVVLESDEMHADESAALAAKLMPRLHHLGLLRTAPG